MRGRSIVLTFALFVSGCVAPAADLLDPASLAALDPIVVPGVTPETLPNGDRLFRIVGETSGMEEIEIDVPAGTTYVEAVAIGTGDVAVSAVLRNAESKAGLCMLQTWVGWNQVTDGPRRCTAIAAMDPGEKWLLQIGRAAGAGGDPTGLGLVSTAEEAPPARTRWRSRSARCRSMGRPRGSSSMCSRSPRSRRRIRSPRSSPPRPTARSSTSRPRCPTPKARSPRS